MRKGGILHPQLNRVLAETGHTDYITVADRGFPIPVQVERVDLALTDNLPTVLDVVRSIHAEFSIDRIILTEEMQSISPKHVEALELALPHIKIVAVPHVQFKALSEQSRAVVRTGDTIPYANVILVSG
ncbi:D-ribose pyranase [Paenibacillus sp. ACRRX]|uniref:D-ribose pyranase n=1 Tax=unclassified Paenibacillus TaxID=185978 RepID=UPI001EF5DD6C|nr:MULTISPECIES: D-ribose pyranase [unclassified Paenibacillus]MCG7407234.1 D-ribose pyranase [Paenibacillus sp. ACRRX]MDK8180453.1 D-ribose pyranase [Paenibacillus sp. UMB4589-SE434]